LMKFVTSHFPSKVLTSIGEIPRFTAEGKLTCGSGPRRAETRIEHALRPPEWPLSYYGLALC
jgi:hypothetical protein